MVLEDVSGILEKVTKFSKEVQGSCKPQRLQGFPRVLEEVEIGLDDVPGSWKRFSGLLREFHVSLRRVWNI